MDRERLKEQLREHALRMVEKVWEEMPRSLRRFGEVERVLKEGTEELGKECLQSWCREAEDDTAACRCPHCGGGMRQKEMAKKQIVSRGGEVEVKRKRWWCEKCGASFFPSGRGGDGGGDGDQPGSGTGSAGGSGRKTV